jgi:transcriptional regulator with XRE-family HTH domain
MLPLKHSFQIKASILEEGGPTLDAMTFGQRLEQAIELGQSDRAKLAKALKISVQAVSQAINGNTKAFSAENTVRAARFLRVDSYWLATGEGQARAPGNLTPDAIQVATLFDGMSERQRRAFLRVLAAFVAEDPGESNNDAKRQT